MGHGRRLHGIRARGATVALAVLLGVGCRDLPSLDAFGYPDAGAEGVDAPVGADVPMIAAVDPHCGLPGWVTMTVDDGGTARTVCAADYPVWGIAGADPATTTPGPDGTFLDTRTTLHWRASPLSGPSTQTVAAAACDALEAAGYRDWRLPTVAEVWSTIDFSRGNPAVALPLQVTPGSVAWTASGKSRSFWTVALADGSSALLSSGAQASAWCVRADPWPKTAPAQRFKVYSIPFGKIPDAVVDQTTGLQWQATASPPPHSQLSAAGWCRNLGIAGHGWRMPTVAELTSIIDRSGPAPAVTPGFFVQPEGVFATISFSAADPNSFWGVDFASGALVPLSIADGEGRAHCVRDPCGDGLCAGAETAKTCPSDCFDRVLVPAATFWQGCDSATDPDCPESDAPAHLVQQDDFLMDRNEITVAQYEACVQWGPCSTLPVNQPAETWPLYRAAPVNYVTWQQAETFCHEWRGAGYFLPTEAHFELAARGGCEQNGSSAKAADCKTKMRYWPWGNVPPNCSLAQFTTAVVPTTATSCAANVQCACGHQGPASVATHEAGASPFGIQDLAGNIAEWTRDSAASYPDNSRLDPTSFSGTPPFIVRGGSFLSDPKNLRSTHRVFADGTAAADIGFRCSSSASVDFGP